MNDETEPQDQAETHDSPEPLDVMRKVFQDEEFNFEEDEDTLSFRLGLKNVDVTVLCSGRANDLANIFVLLPIRAAEEFRANTGEFLHRLNYVARRMSWEMDYNDGEIRFVSAADTIAGPLTEAHFRRILHSMVVTADIVFPYLTSVLSGRMTPDILRMSAPVAFPATLSTFPVSYEALSRGCCR